VAWAVRHAIVTGRYPAVTRTGLVARSSIASRDVRGVLAVRIVAFGGGIVATP
jgi:hypothetical protein